jgi:hypothetical protein
MDEARQILAAICSTPSESEACAAIVELSHVLISKEVAIDSFLLKQTRKISQKFGYALYPHIPRLYLRYLQTVNRNDSDLLITLCNDALAVKDTISGTDLSEKLSSSVKEMLLYLSQNNTLDLQQAEVISQLSASTHIIDFDLELQSVVEELDNDPATSMHMLIDVFSTLTSTREQFFRFSAGLATFIKALEQRRSVETYSLVVKFLDIFFPPLTYKITANGTTAEYRLSNLSLFDEYEEAFTTAVAILKVLVRADRYISECSVKVIHKLWNLYPRLRTGLYDLVLANLKTVNNGNAQEPRRRAAEMLYSILHDRELEPKFKERVRAEDFEGLAKEAGYGPAVMNGVSLAELKISAGYPVCCEINPGEEFSYYVEVTEPGSVLFWAFATEENDISYKISQLGATSTLLYNFERVNCDTNPVVGSLLALKPSLFKFEWSNHFSWFQAKRLRYRICVLVPVPENSAHSARGIKFVNRKPSEEAFDTETSEIGFAISSKAVEVYTDHSITVPIDSLSTPKSVIESYCSSSETREKRLGIVLNDPSCLELDLKTEILAICRDVDALALMTYDQFPGKTVIAVLECDGIRSAVVTGGKLFSAGDVANLKNKEPAVAISTLLSFFGPATVALVNLDLEKLSDRVRTLVPIGIWNHSQLVQGKFSLAQCAARLHFLLDKYRSIL